MAGNINWKNNKISMVTAIIKRAVGDDDIGGGSMLVASTLLRAYHNER
jgi:hypothetical protein